jgi:hypothetical protein
MPTPYSLHGQLRSIFCSVTRGTDPGSRYLINISSSFPFGGGRRLSTADISVTFSSANARYSSNDPYHAVLLYKQYIGLHSSESILTRRASSFAQTIEAYNVFLPQCTDGHRTIPTRT